ncbi:MAG TPA: S-layer homology domain-containing protein [Firmicutes bacterium]|mgnify:CR=1 FL=1|nr:S-layer homology domain-containing protein [Bacillota bacterium]
MLKTLRRKGLCWLVLTLAVLEAAVPVRANDAVLGRVGAGETPAPKEAHWAWAPAKALLDAGIGGAELRAALESEAGLNRSITPLEWNAYVARAVGEEPGAGETGGRRYWLYAYTADEAGGGRSVVSRGYAAAGLAKIGNMYGFISGSGGALEHLRRFTDWRWLEEKGYAGPCEEMAAAGILTGYPDGTLRPEAPLTRGEAAALLKGWLEYWEKLQGKKRGRR